jgi:hypothetical protein
MQYISFINLFFIPFISVFIHLNKQENFSFNLKSFLVYAIYTVVNFLAVHIFIVIIRIVFKKTIFDCSYFYSIIAVAVAVITPIIQSIIAKWISITFTIENKNEK